MSDHSKHIIPIDTDYTVQSNQISQSAYTMPATLRKLIFLIMAHIRPGDDVMSITMDVGSVFSALEMTDGGKQRKLLKEAIAPALQQILHIKTETGWKLHQWLSEAEYNNNNETMTFTVHENLRPYVMELQNQFQFFSISDISRLQGKYSLRIFEISVSYSGFAGKNGNAKNCWFWEMSIKELRERFMVLNEYPRTGDFRTYVIDRPIQEINSADLGIRIVPEYQRKGRRLLGIRFNCEHCDRSKPRKVNAATQTEEDDQELINQNPERYYVILHELREEAKNQPSLFKFDISAETEDVVLQGKAIERLKKELKQQKTSI